MCTPAKGQINKPKPKIALYLYMLVHSRLHLWANNLRAIEKPKAAVDGMKEKFYMSKPKLNNKGTYIAGSCRVPVLMKTTPLGST